MKSFRFFFISTLIFFFGFAAVAKNQVIYIDPKFENTVPVYGVDKNGKFTKELTSLVPGDFASVKEMRKIGGKNWFILKAKDETGKDIEVALDPDSVNAGTENSAVFVAPANARKVKVSGDEKSSSTDTPGLDQEACALAKTAGGEICKDLSPGDDVEVDDAVLALTTDGESPKLKWRNYVRGKDGYWIDTENTTRVDDSWSGIEEPRTAEECETKPADYAEIPTMAEEAAKLGTEKQLEMIMKNIGDCHETKSTGDYHKALVDGVANKPLGLLYKEMKLDGTTQIVNANRSDWVAIDVLARTLYGEMASCFKKGHQYPESVAKVVLNRVDFNKENPGPGKRFIDPKDKTDRRNDITNAAFKDYQFSIWNREDKARRMAMCPPSSADKNFWKGAKPDESELKIWKDAVRIASQAVLQGETFRKKNKDLKALYYTSDFELSKKDYKPITNATIAGKKLPMSRCVQLWSEKKLKTQYPEWGIFHPLMQEALLPVAGL